MTPCRAALLGARPSQHKPSNHSPHSALISACLQHPALGTRQLVTTPSPKYSVSHPDLLPCSPGLSRGHTSKGCGPAGPLLLAASSPAWCSPSSPHPVVLRGTCGLLLLGSDAHAFVQWHWPLCRHSATFINPDQAATSPSSGPRIPAHHGPPHARSP